jgi:hypothetical protein
MTGPVAALADDLYAVSGAGNSASTLYRLDPTTGAVLETIGALGINHVVGLAYDPSTGTLYGHRNDVAAGEVGRLYTIDLTTGAATLVGITNITSPDMTIDPSGQLFAWMEFENSGAFQDDLYTINKITGAASRVGESGQATGATGLGFQGSTLFMKSGNTLFTVNPATGVATLVGTISYSGGDTALDNSPTFDSSGAGFGIDRSSGTSLLVSINVSGLSASVIGDTGIANMAALAFAPSVIPEPGTLALLGLGAAGTFAAVRSRRKKRLRVNYPRG